jgi:hypothetical protein
VFSFEFSKSSEYFTNYRAFERIDMQFCQILEMIFALIRLCLKNIGCASQGGLLVSAVHGVVLHALVRCLYAATAALDF